LFDHLFEARHITTAHSAPQRSHRIQILPVLRRIRVNRLTCNKWCSEIERLRDRVRQNGGGRLCKAQASKQASSTAERFTRRFVRQIRQIIILFVVAVILIIHCSQNQSFVQARNATTTNNQKHKHSNRPGSTGGLTLSLASSSSSSSSSSS
jgi:hypothetical protein